MSFINPIPSGYWTSRFGYRTHPVTGKKGSFHQGIDIARQPNTNVEVVASADGEVIRVGTLGTYGKIVMIKHSVNGRRMDTNYAHLASYNVKVGQKVKQGQKIGIMGNTGSSTAPHLHFEIHDGAWLTGQPNAVNPEKFITFYSKSEVLNMEKEIKELKSELKALKEEMKSFKKEPVYKEKEAPSNWAKESVAWGIENKITDGTYLKRSATREEQVAMIHRLFKLVKG